MYSIADVLDGGPLVHVDEGAPGSRLRGEVAASRVIGREGLRIWFGQVWTLSAWTERVSIGNAVTEGSGTFDRSWPSHAIKRWSHLRH